MTMTSWGYNGTIDETQWAQMSEFFGTRYAVRAAGDWAMTGVPNERQVSVAPGLGYGHGVTDLSDAAVALSIPAPTETVGRFHLVIARRNWSNNDTSFALIAGPGTDGTTPTLPPATLPAELNDGPGTLDDQPLGWAWVKTSSTNVIIFDLRTFPIGDTIELIPAQVAAALAAVNIPGQVSNYFQEAPEVLAVAVDALTLDARSARDQAQASAAGAAADREAIELLVIDDLGTTDSQSAALLAADVSATSAAADARTARAGDEGGVLERVFAPSPLGKAPMPRSLRRSRTALAAARNKTGEFFNCMFVGDSISTGAGANGPLNVHSFPERLRQMLADRGYPSAGTGFVWPFVNMIGNSPGPDPRWQFSGGFGNLGDAKTSFMGSSANGALARFTPLVECERISFFYSENSGAFRYRIEGEAWINIAAGAPLGETWKEIVIHVTAGSSYALQIETLSTAGVFIGPARAWMNSGGVLVNNTAVAGSISTYWRDDAMWFELGPLAETVAQGLDLVVIESTMVNDKTVGISPAQHKLNLDNIVSWALTVSNGGEGAPIAPAEVIVWAPPPIAGMSVEVRASYIAVIQEVADAHGVPFIDMAHRYGETYEEAELLWIYADGTHPNSRGYTDIATAFLPLLVP